MPVPTAGLILGLFAACSEPEPEAPVPVDTAQTEVPPTDTGCEPDCPPDDDWFDVKYLFVHAHFGFDTARGIVDVTAPFGTIRSQIEILLGSEDWEHVEFDPEATEAYCALILPLSLTAPPSWTGDLWFALDYDPSNGATTNCTGPDYELDPAVWGDGVISTLVDGHPWGVGVGPLWPDYVALYAGTTLDPYVHGGYVYNDILPPPDGTRGYISLATEMSRDDELNIVNGDRVLVPADDIQTGGLPAPLAHGEYNIYSFEPWVF